MSRTYEIQRKINTGGFVTIDTVVDLYSYDDDYDFDDGDTYTYRVRQTDPYTSGWSNESSVEFSVIESSCILETHASASGFRSDEYVTTIPKGRNATFVVAVGRTDGETWTDLSDYTLDISASLGDVSRIGTGNQGGDSVARQMSLVLAQDNESLWPLNKSSSFNMLGGSYSPLLYPAREIRLSIALQETDDEYTQMFGTTQSIGEVIGTGTGVEQTFSTYYSPIVPDTEVVYVDDVETDSYTIDYDSGEITTTLTGEISINYVYYQPIFAGYLGDSIQQNSDGSEIKLKARDFSKVLQNAYIMGSQEYGSEEGDLIEDVIQEILDDNLDNPPTLKVIGTPGGAVKPYNVEYTTVFEATQQLAAKIGWFLGYKWDWSSQQWRYTLMEPPRDKDFGTANYYITALDDVYDASLDINDVDVRNDITIEYRDEETGKRESVNVRDEDSINEFGLRQMLIGEADTSLINTEEEALAFATAALKDLKGLSATNKLIFPILPELDVFHGIILENPIQSEGVKFYAVESVRMTLKVGKNNAKSTLTTEAVCSGSVKGSHNKWLAMETRPGANERIKPEELYDRTSPRLPANLRASFDGRDAIFNWDQPTDSDYQSSRIELYVSDVLVRETYVNSNQYIYTYDNNVEDNTNPAPEVTMKLYHVDSAGQESSVGTVIAVNPAPPTPTGLSVTSTQSQLLISVNKPLVTDLDKVEYQIDDTSNFDNPTTYLDTSFTKSAIVRVEGTNYVRVRFIDDFDQPGSWKTESTEGVMLSMEDIVGGASFNISPSSNPSKTKAELAQLWDLDTSTGVTFSGSFSVTFDYPIEWFFDMVRFYVNEEADYTVEAYDFDEEEWITVITPKTCVANEWTVQRFDGNEMFATGRLRISFTCGTMTIYELKFWTVTLSDEILAQTMTLTGNMAIQNEDSSILIDTEKIMLRDSETGDYAYLSPEMLAFYKDGYEGVPMWYSKRIAHGITDDGGYVNLTTETGVPWDKKPKVLTAAAELASYDAAYSADTQSYKTEAYEVSKNGFYVSGKLMIVGNSDDFDIQTESSIATGDVYENQSATDSGRYYTVDSSYNNTTEIRAYVYCRASYFLGDNSPPGDYWNIYDDTLRIWISSMSWDLTFAYTNVDTDTTVIYDNWTGSRNSFYLGDNPGLEHSYYPLSFEILIEDLPEATYNCEWYGEVSLTTGASGDSGGKASIYAPMSSGHFAGTQIVNTGKVAWIAMEGGESDYAE